MRRMLTDKLTKSIKEVVNAYNEGEFSAVSANPETTTETLTGIEINGVGYAVSGGSGSVEIDNKTIIENADGKLETAVGGYTETETITLTSIALVGSGADWDLVDETLCNEYLAVLEDGVHYPVEVTFAGTTVPSPGIKSAELYCSSTESANYGYGNGSTLKITDNEDNVHSWQFYIKNVSEGKNNIHVWPSDSWITPASESTLTIAPAAITKEIVHAIDSKYVNYEFVMNSSHVELTNDEYNFIYNNKNNILLSYNGRKYRLSDEDENRLVFLSDTGFNSQYSEISVHEAYLYPFNKTLSINDNGYRSVVTDDLTTKFTYNSGYKLSTVIGGGYSGADIPVASADFTASGADYICTNADFQNAFIKTLCGISLNNGWTSFNIHFENISQVEVDCYVNVSNTSSGNIVTFTLNTISSGTIEYNTSTGEYTISNILFNNVIPDLVSGNNIIAFKNDYPQYAAIKETVKSEFLPGFNNVPTVAGTYTLQVTVDAQGNPTYTWVSTNV